MSSEQIEVKAYSVNVGDIIAVDDSYEAINFETSEKVVVTKVEGDVFFYKSI